MELFKSVQFEQNEVGDTACKQMFSNPYGKKGLANKGVKNKPNKLRGIKKKKKRKDGNVMLTIKASKNEKFKLEKGDDVTSNTNLVNLIKKNDLKNRTKNKKEGKKRISNKTKASSLKNIKTQNLNKKNKVLSPSESSHKPNLQNIETTAARKSKSKKLENKEIEIRSNINKQSSHEDDHSVIPDFQRKKKDKLKNKLEEMLQSKTITETKKTAKKSYKPPLSLRQRMMDKLKSARFRYLNEQIYSSDSKGAQELFKSDPEAFKVYHEGYRQQINKWPLNPLDVIIQSIQKMPKTHVIADFGCGDATLAKTVKQTVHSFDLVANNELVTVCDMAHVPLENNSVDVVVFCLSLMGTNLHDYLLEANRVLKVGGMLKIAEVESRFDDIKEFIEGVSKFHFKCIWQDLSHNLFYFLNFIKEANIKNKKTLPTLSLNPCLYKKR